ncbi:MAG: DNA sulfur modification protein DndB [Clostridia bacterium]
MMSYKFPAVKGKQANSEYFICMVPLGILSKLFISDDNDVGAEFRAQRKLNHARIPEIKNYILNNRDGYVFSALAASVDGLLFFRNSELDENVGIIEISMDASFLINDGQHRKAAINAAIEEDGTLKDETIAVVLYKDKGLERSQQMFTDLNKHAVITSKSQNALYDSKDPIAILSKKLIKKNDFFRKYTDKEKDNLGKFSSNIFTLNNILNANTEIFKYKIDDMEEAESFMYDFWENVVKNIKEWQEMDKGLLNKKDLREQYIITQGVAIRAIGMIGHWIYKEKSINMMTHLENLRFIDWLRNNPDWIGRALKPNGRISMNGKGVFLTYVEIKRKLGLTITQEEMYKENL